MKHRLFCSVLVFLLVPFLAVSLGSQEKPEVTSSPQPEAPSVQTEESAEAETAPVKVPSADTADTSTETAEAKTSQAEPARAVAAPGQKADITVGPNGDFQDIQEAIDYARNGETILIEEGIYEVDDSLYISGKSDITLKGDGYVDIIGQTYVHSLVVENSSYIIIENLHLVHRMHAAVVNCGGADVMRLENCDYVSISGCELNGCGNIGVHVLGCGNVDIINNYIHSNTTSGIEVDKYSSAPLRVYIEGNRIINNSTKPVDFRGKILYRDSKTQGLEMVNNVIYPND